MFIRLLLSAILATGLASAQRGGGGEDGIGGGGMEGGMGRGMGGGMGGMGGGGGMSRMVRPSKLEMFADKLKLSKEQKEELLKVLSAGREEAMPLRQPIEQERVNITESILNGKADTLKKSLDNYAALMAQMAGVEAKAFAKVLATLKPNQQSKSAQAFELLAGTFDPPASRSGMGRGGRGRN
jgi:uncharacterized membrane protein